VRGQGVVELPGGVVFGVRGYFGPDPNGVLPASALWGSRAHTIAESERALAVGLEELDGVTMSVCGTMNHAHSLLQSVPRLDLLRRAWELEADRILVTRQPAMIEALAVLGITTDRLMFVPFDSAPAYRCAMLRAATPPPFPPAGVDWVIDFLHELFLREPPAPSSRRLYVGRGRTKRRVVLNEDEVLALLEPAGFEAVSMDGRSVTEQAEIFASAEIVVSTHGAALANLVFCRPGTAIIELMGTNTATRAFADIAWGRGLNYNLIMGTEPAPPDRWWKWDPSADTIVDVPGLRRNLQQLGVL
jgi:capsular polysaccharide biosynthesis protein